MTGTNHLSSNPTAKINCLSIITGFGQRYFVNTLDNLWKRPFFQSPIVVTSSYSTCACFRRTEVIIGMGLWNIPPPKKKKAHWHWAHRYNLVRPKKWHRRRSYNIFIIFHWRTRGSTSTVIILRAGMPLTYSESKTVQQDHAKYRTICWKRSRHQKIFVIDRATQIQIKHRTNLCNICWSKMSLWQLRQVWDYLGDPV